MLSATPCHCPPHPRLRLLRPSLHPLHLSIAVRSSAVGSPSGAVDGRFAAALLLPLRVSHCRFPLSSPSPVAPSPRDTAPLTRAPCPTVSRFSVLLTRISSPLDPAPPTPRLSRQLPFMRLQPGAVAVDAAVAASNRRCLIQLSVDAMTPVRPFCRRSVQGPSTASSAVACLSSIACQPVYHPLLPGDALARRASAARPDARTSKTAHGPPRCMPAIPAAT